MMRRAPGDDHPTRVTTVRPCTTAIATTARPGWLNIVHCGAFLQ
jgi:hypothetical protein